MQMEGSYNFFSDRDSIAREELEKALAKSYEDDLIV